MKTLKKIIDKTQGSAARLMDKMPAKVQQRLAKTLGYNYDFKELNAFYKCTLAIQHLQNQHAFISKDYQKSRDIFEAQMQSILDKPTAIKKVKDIKLLLTQGEILARHYHPAPKKSLPLVVFYHGGGWVVGSINTHDEACRLLAKHANVQVLSINYPLAPENGPEQIVNTCVQSLEWIYKNAKKFKILKNRIAVAGDSAGGNLSAVVSQKTQYTPYTPSAQLLIYPAMDFKNRYASFYKFREGLVLCQEDIDAVTEMYPEKHNVALDDPLISPLYGDYQKVAPAFIITAGFDLLHDEGQIYASKLKDAGIKVHYTEAKDQPHGFINFTPIHQAAKNHWIKTAKDFRTFWDKQK